MKDPELTPKRIKQASKLAIKNMKALSGKQINSLNAMYEADHFKPLASKKKRL